MIETKNIEDYINRCIFTCFERSGLLIPRGSLQVVMDEDGGDGAPDWRILMTRVKHEKEESVIQTLVTLTINAVKKTASLTLTTPTDKTPIALPYQMGIELFVAVASMYYTVVRAERIKLDAVDHMDTASEDLRRQCEMFLTVAGVKEGSSYFSKLYETISNGFDIVTDPVLLNHMRRGIGEEVEGDAATLVEAAADAEVAADAEAAADASVGADASTADETSTAGAELDSAVDSADLASHVPSEQPPTEIPQAHE